MFEKTVDLETNPLFSWYRTLPIHEIHGAIWVLGWYSHKTLQRNNKMYHSVNHSYELDIFLSYAHLILCICESLTKGWSFLQALRSCDSLLKAIPDMTQQRHPAARKTHHQTCRRCIRKDRNTHYRSAYMNIMSKDTSHEVLCWTTFHFVSATTLQHSSPSLASYALAVNNYSRWLTLNKCFKMPFQAIPNGFSQWF